LADLELDDEADSEERSDVLLFKTDFKGVRVLKFSLVLE
jgi:hypothetical protein